MVLTDLVVVSIEGNKASLKGQQSIFDKEWENSTEKVHDLHPLYKL